MLELSHKKLQVYQFALQLVKEVYQHTKSYPKEEQFVLISQLRRAATWQKEPQETQKLKRA